MKKVERIDDELMNKQGCYPEVGHCLPGGRLLAIRRVPFTYPVVRSWLSEGKRQVIGKTG